MRATVFEKPPVDQVAAKLIAERGYADRVSVLAGDMFYERKLAVAALPWLRGLVARGALVLLGDPGRAYLPETGLTEVAAYSVPTTRELEDREMREGRIWRLSA